MTRELPNPETTNRPRYRHVVDSTPFGPVALVWEQPRDAPRLVRVLLSRPGRSAEALVRVRYPNTKQRCCSGIERLAEQIARLLNGAPLAFPLSWVALDACSTFQQQVLRAEHRIPRGHVSSYGRIAAELSRPGAARAVGRALASNPFPLIVPCHRAVRSDGRLGGFQGGTEMKRALLEAEGVRIDAAGRVAVDAFCPP